MKKKILMLVPVCFPVDARQRSLYFLPLLQARSQEPWDRQSKCPIAGANVIKLAPLLMTKRQHKLQYFLKCLPVLRPRNLHLFIINYSLFYCWATASSQWATVFFPVKHFTLCVRQGAYTQVLNLSKFTAYWKFDDRLEKLSRDKHKIIWPLHRRGRRML